ncbi:hypothetical protein F5148DRAFT_1215805 [Russula earlei]|uniref:Uncharacterized protein n=1 Tax=Russula earlei TaxID=71964 RepID=A0ACC0U3E5_9AGAM|nr:hypothetical protein F5148DRAFT_1215805 [Russula earlei]
MSIFDGVKFFCTSTLSHKQNADLTRLLEHNGGERTHIITLSLDYEGQDGAKEGSATVTDHWVERSLILGRLQLVQHFSPDPTMLFSGVVACATDLAPSDAEVLSAGVTALGGQWRAGLTRDVTHLFAVRPGTEKYQTALRYREETQIKVLVPHWFDDSVRLGIRGLSTSPYEWPEPAILTHGKPSPETCQVGDDVLRRQNKLSQGQRALYKAVLMTAEQELKLGHAKRRDIWGSRRILLSPDLDLSDDRQHAIEAGIIRSGGVVVEYDAQHANADYEFDILVARYRWGPLYVQGVKERKLVGSLIWLFHVESTGTISSPTAQLLHYPITKKPIETFSAHEITVTNYTGDARDYLKKLIRLMGATFTPSMSGKNTVLVAAYMSGNKATKARNWSIPIVNHTWLEDCFIQWRNLSVGLERYVVFPPGLDFSTHLGERGIQREIIYESLPDLMAEMAQPNVNPTEKGSNHHNGENLSLLLRKTPKARIAREADCVMGRPETEHGEDVDAQSQLGVQGLAEDHVQAVELLPSRASVRNAELERAIGSSGQGIHGSSSLQRFSPPPQRTNEAPSGSKPRRRVDQETAEGVLSPSRMSEHSKAGFPVRNSSRNSPSIPRATTPLRIESVLVPHIGTGEALGRSPQQLAMSTSPVKANPKDRASHSKLISGEHPLPMPAFTDDATQDGKEGPSRRTSRRSAASKATRRLREEVMPDVVNFEKEMRRGHVRAVNLESEQGEEKTYRALKASDKGKKRPSVQHAVDGNVSSDGEHERKKRRLDDAKAHDHFKHLDGGGRVSITGADPQNTGGAKGNKMKQSFGGESSGISVGILATQVNLDEGEERALAKLGARVGVRPDECTHLVVKTLARTEKLLCAMAVAPAVVTEKWVRDSIVAKKILPADAYALADPVNEKKWEFKLADALKRAKANRGQLFAGKVFYVTNKVPLDKKLLKNVVSAHGGQLRHQNPTLRMLTDKRSDRHYVISCLEDVSIWRPFAEAGHAIYSQELILSAALTQEIRLNAEVRLDTL